MEEEGNAYACLDTHTQKFRIINIQIEKENRHMSRVMRTKKTLFQRHLLNLQGKKKENKKNTQPNTNHAALATQLERQVEKKVYTYNTDP